jgi:hypothetical protein
VRLWDTRTRARVATFRVHEDFVADMHQAEAKSALLTASGDGTLAVLDLRASQVSARSDNQEDELLSGARPRSARVQPAQARPRRRVWHAAGVLRARRLMMIPRVAMPLGAVGTHIMLKFLRPRARTRARTHTPSASRSPSQLALPHLTPAPLAPRLQWR